MSRRDWMELAQKAVNAYVRERDKGKPCISCETAWAETFQAGHFRSRGACPELRFELDNIHGQCISCNLHRGGNILGYTRRTLDDEDEEFEQPQDSLGYRKGLIARIGLERVERLEGPHPPAKWSIDELKTIRDAYRLLLKQERERHAV